MVHQHDAPPQPWLNSYDAATSQTFTPQPESVCAMLDRAAARAPDRAAYIFRNSRVSFAQVRDTAETMAANLRDHGLQTGDRVAIMLPNLPQLAISFWAVQKAGGIVVLTNPLYMEKELEHLLTDARVKYMITIDACWPKLSPLRDRLGVKKYFITSIADTFQFPHDWVYRLKTMKERAVKSVPFDGESVLPYKNLTRGNKRFATAVADPVHQIAAIQYTGGTTGEPKGVELTHANFSVNVAQTIDILHVLKDKQQVIAALLPLFHVYGLSMSMLLPMALAAPCVLIPRYEPKELLETLSKHKVTVFPGAPSVYLSLMQHKDLHKYDLSALSYAISGSAPISAEALTRFKEKTGCAVIEGYGLTECSPITHLNPATGKHRFGSIGLPLPGTDAQIVDMDIGSVVLAPGKIGELVIRGPQVMKGYHNQTAETAGTIRDAWLYTGDIAYMDEDGYFFIVDRKKDMVIVGGYNVYPREIDDVLLEHPGIKEAVAVAILHPTRGETLKAFVVPKEGVTLSVPDIITYCRKKLANYKVPRQIEFRDTLPRAITGKVLRRLLRDEAIARNASAAHESPRPQNAAGRTEDS